MCNSILHIRNIFCRKIFVNVPLEQYDAAAVNMARTMVMSFYILAVGLYDSVYVLSNAKKHRLNIIVMAFSVLSVLFINIPGIAVNIGLMPMSAEAFKFVIFFSLVPVLIKGAEGSISNRRG